MRTIPGDAFVLPTRQTLSVWLGDDEVDVTDARIETTLRIDDRTTLVVTLRTTGHLTGYEIGQRVRVRIVGGLWAWDLEMAVGRITYGRTGRYKETDIDLEWVEVVR